MKKILNHDSFTGITDYFEHDSATGKNIIQSVQDIDPILEINKMEGEYLDKRENWWKVGSIPLVMCQKWAEESGTIVWSKEWHEYAKKQLNHSDYRKLNPNKIKL